MLGCEKGEIMTKDAASSKPQVGDLKVPKQVRTQLPKNGEVSQPETMAKPSKLNNLQIGLILSFALTLILFIISISVMIGMESRLADLEDEVFFLEDRVTSLEDRVKNLETDVLSIDGGLTDTRDWISEEVNGIQNCINDFIDVWAQHQSYALYCR